MSNGLADWFASPSLQCSRGIFHEPYLNSFSPSISSDICFHFSGMLRDSSCSVCVPPFLVFPCFQLRVSHFHFSCISSNCGLFIFFLLSCEAQEPMDPRDCNNKSLAIGNHTVNVEIATYLEKCIVIQNCTFAGASSLI